MVRNTSGRATGRSSTNSKPQTVRPRGAEHPLSKSHGEAQEALARADEQRAADALQAAQTQQVNANRSAAASRQKGTNK